jgi:hypothetical protein
MTPDPHTLEGLLPYVEEGRRQEFSSYVDQLIETDECFGIDHSFLGFMGDYVQYAALLLRKVDVHDAPWDRQRPLLTVYDVGCATALQHVVFDPRILYVGIDMGDQP